MFKVPSSAPHEGSSSSDAKSHRLKIDGKTAGGPAIEPGAKSAESAVTTAALSQRVGQGPPKLCRAASANCKIALD